MSEAPSSSRVCNHCNIRATFITFGDLVFCCQCKNILVPTAYSSPPPPPLPSPQKLVYRSLEAIYIELINIAASLQNIAKVVDGGRRGAPPAPKSAIEALETFEVVCSTSSEVCAVCKDAMLIGEIWKKLPCGHCYHGNCILPWLRKRNSCPLCRFQL